MTKKKLPATVLGLSAPDGLDTRLIPAGPAPALDIHLQGYLAHERYPPPRTLQQDYAQGPLVVLGGGAISYERGTPVCPYLLVS